MDFCLFASNWMSSLLYCSCLVGMPNWHVLFEKTQTIRRDRCGNGLCGEFSTNTDKRLEKRSETG